MASDGFPRLMLVCTTWSRAPSTYMKGLTELEAFFLDEAGAAWVILTRAPDPRELEAAREGAEWKGDRVL